MESTSQCSKNLSNQSNEVSKLDYWKKHYLNLPLSEKRKHYYCKSFITLDLISPWNETKESTNTENEFKIDDNLNSKISISKSSIISLEVDAIVNAANENLSHGGGVCGAIFDAAGKELLRENCAELKSCKTGEAKLSYGFKLPAKYIIHTVGPFGENQELLSSCYENSLNLAKKHNLKTIAFPCISTGIFGYPVEPAANVALRTVRKWLEKNSNDINRIIFCLFTPADSKAYSRYLPIYFPK